MNAADFIKELKRHNKAARGTHKLGRKLSDKQYAKFCKQHAEYSLPGDLLQFLQKHNGFTLFCDPDSPVGGEFRLYTLADMETSDKVDPSLTEGVDGKFLLLTRDDHALGSVIYRVDRGRYSFLPSMEGPYHIADTFDELLAWIHREHVEPKVKELERRAAEEKRIEKLIANMSDEQRADIDMLVGRLKAAPMRPRGTHDKDFVDDPEVEAALERIVDCELAPALINALRSERDIKRKSFHDAAIHVSKLRCLPVIAVLIELLKRKYEQPYSPITTVMPYLGDAAIAPFVELLVRSDKSPQYDQTMVAEMIGRMGPHGVDAVGPLVDCLQHRQWLVEKSASDALKRIGSAAAETLRERLEAAEDESLRRKIKEVLETLPVVSASEDEPGEIRQLPTALLPAPVHFSHDGKSFLCGNYRWWDVATGQVERSLPWHSGIWRLALAADGDSFAAASGNNVLIIDNKTGEVLKTLEHDNRVNSVTYMQDGRLLASGWDGIVRVWDLTTGDETRPIEASESGYWGHALSPGERWLALVTQDNRFVVHDFVSGKLVAEYSGCYDTDESRIGFTPDGCFLLIGDHVWDLAEGVWRKPSFYVGDHRIVPHSSWVVSAGGQEEALYVWDYRTGELHFSSRVPPRDLKSLSISTDGTQAVSKDSQNLTLRQWRLPKYNGPPVLLDPPANLVWPTKPAHECRDEVVLGE